MQQFDVNETYPSGKSDMQCEVWVTASCRLIAILLISCRPLFSQRKVLSEIGQVCGEIKKTFIFVWNRSGWAASKSFYWPVSER